MDLHNLINLINGYLFFKESGFCIDLLPTKYSFKNAKAFETSLSDHHLLIYSVCLKLLLGKMSRKD